MLNLLLVKAPEVYIDANIQTDHQIHGATYLPLGIMHLHAYVKRHCPGVRAEMLDLHLRCRQPAGQHHPAGISSLERMRSALCDALVRHKPDILGISCAINAFGDNVHAIARLAKEAMPGITVIAGGHYASSRTDLAVGDEHIDHVILGEGELPLAAYLDERLRGLKHTAKVLNERRYLPEIETFPDIDYDAVGIEDYLRTPMSTLGADEGRVVNVLTSRGCPGRCIYCATHSVWDYGFRRQSPRKIFEQVVELKERYGVQTVAFVDDNFILDKPRVKEFARLLIEHKVDIKWYPTSVRINSLDREMISLMAEAGCTGMALAVESANPEMQKLIRKRVRLDHAMEMAQHMRDCGMRVFSLLMLGFPGETLEDIRQTIAFAKAMPCDWHMINVSTPLYGTEMYDICRDRGYLPADKPLLQIPGRGSISTPEFTAEQVEQLKNDANYRLNFLENANFLAGRYDRVISIFKAIEANYPDHFICKYMLWKYHDAAGDLPLGEYFRAELERIAAADPEHSAQIISRYSLSGWSRPTNR